MRNGPDDLDAFAQIAPVIRTASPKITEMWIETYERTSHFESPVFRWRIPWTPATMNPTSAQVASGTWR
jgi:hypothetical protein